jgi:hypothetical protein
MRQEAAIVVEAFMFLFLSWGDIPGSRVSPYAKVKILQGNWRLERRNWNLGISEGLIDN